jgi:putative toxin-antitoxin system antitoxin component (TIGR02293 family)
MAKAEKYKPVVGKKNKLSSKAGRVILSNAKIIQVPLEFSKNPIEFIDLASKGLSVEAFDKVVVESGYNKEELAKFMGINMRTIQNKRKSGGEIAQKDAEHLLKLRELFKRGQEIFGSKEEFKRWMDKPAFGLDNRPPASLINFISGIDLVGRELTRIEYGDFS